MLNEAESILWLTRLVADSALKHSDIGRIIIGALYKDGFLDRIKREKTSNQDIAILYKSFDAFTRVADEVCRRGAKK